MDKKPEVASKPVEIANKSRETKIYTVQKRDGVMREWH